MKTTVSAIIGALAFLILFPAPTNAAATVKSASGLSTGRIEITTTHNTTTTIPVFSTNTQKKTIAKKWNKNYAIALRHDGRQVALVKPNGTVKKTKLTGKVSTSAALLTKTIDDEKLAFVVNKKKSTVRVFILDKEGKRLEIQDTETVRNKSIRPKKTQYKDSTDRLLLRNKYKTVKEKFWVSDLNLLPFNDPVTCAGTWYESHAHFEEGEELIEKQIDRMNENNIGCSLAFVGMNFDTGDIAEEYDRLQNIVAMSPGRFIPFYNGDTSSRSVSEITATNLQKILNKDSDNLFRGIGEFAFYQSPLLGTELTTDAWDDIFEFAADNDLILMIHLNNDQGTELEQMLTDHPNTTVLLHGNELLSELPDILASHSNLYYTLDTANMLRDPNDDTGVLMFPVRAGNGEDTTPDKERASEFIETYDANEAEMLSTAVTDYADLFTAAPTQMLWGTDVAFTWHLRTGVYNRLMSFSEQYADQLDESVQDAYRHDNAAALFGDGATRE